MEKAGCREYCQLKLQSDELSVSNSMREKRGAGITMMWESLCFLSLHTQGAVHGDEVLQ